MATKSTFMVQTFVIKRKRLVPGDREIAPTEFGALKKAEAMAGRMPGTAAVKVVADDETGELEAATILGQFGEVPDYYADRLDGQLIPTRNQLTEAVMALGSARMIARGRMHTSEVERETLKYLQTVAINITTEICSISSDVLFYANLSSEIPGSIEEATNDAVSNFRSALDYAINENSRKFANVVPDNTSFPFAGTPDDLETKLNNKHMRLLPEEFKNMIRDLRPYKNGNKNLYLLNQIRIKGQHKGLVSAFASPVKVGFKNGVINKLETKEFTPFYDRENNKLLFLRATHETAMNIQIRPIIKIIFDDSIIQSGMNIYQDLSEMGEDIERTVALIAACADHIVNR